MVMGSPWTPRLRESGGGIEGEEEVERPVHVGGGTDGVAGGTPAVPAATPAVPGGGEEEEQGKQWEQKTWEQMMGGLVIWIVILI